MAATRTQNAYLAKLAKKAGRFEEMMEYMEKIARAAALEEKELTTEERELLSEAYKNVIGSRRAILKNVSSMEKKEVDLGNQNNVASIRSHRERVESELSSMCGDIFCVIDSILIPISRNPESKVFYLKMKGDYYRHLVELKTGSDRKDAADNTLSCYKAAQDIARAELGTRHPIRLNLALNFSTFYFESLYSPEMAYTLAKQAYDDATADLGTLVREESFKDSFSIIQLLRDKVDSWQAVKRPT